MPIVAFEGIDRRSECLAVHLAGLARDKGVAFPGFDVHGRHAGHLLQRRLNFPFVEITELAGQRRAILSHELETRKG